MITQNPLTGRSRKKLAGVYARTLWHKNVIQSCPKPSSTPPTQALKDSRAAFALVMQMANMVPCPLLSYIFYTAPIGRSRRHVLSSQLYGGVLRNDKQISFDVNAIKQFGTNPVSSVAGLVYTIPDKSFSIPKSSFSATQIADTSRVPCIFAISYDLGVCVPFYDYTTIDGDDLIFSNISDTFLDKSVLLLPLWQINIGSASNPVWVLGRFQAES